MRRLISIALVMGDLALMALAFGSGAQATWWFGAGHLGMTGAALWAERRRAMGAAGWAGLALPLGAVLGPAGIAAGCAAMRHWSEAGRGRALVPAGRRRAVAAYDPDRRSASRTILARTLDDRIRFSPSTQIESLRTVLRHGKLTARRMALEAAVRAFEPRLTPLIALALLDEDQTIRSLAAAATAQASHNLAQSVKEFIACDDMDDKGYALTLSLIDHGRHNVLLSQSQRTELCDLARARILSLQEAVPAEDEQRGALVRALSSIAPATPVEASHGRLPGHRRGLVVAT